MFSQHFLFLRRGTLKGQHLHRQDSQLSSIQKHMLPIDDKAFPKFVVILLCICFIIIISMRKYNIKHCNEGSSLNDFNIGGCFVYYFIDLFSDRMCISMILTKLVDCCTKCGPCDQASSYMSVPAIHTICHTILASVEIAKV